MTTEKIYGPWIEWHGGDCPVPFDTVVEVALHSEFLLGPRSAARYAWNHLGTRTDIIAYRTVTKQPDLEAAENLLRENGYTVIPPAKPLTFEDVVPMTEAPHEGARYWVVSAAERDGVCSVPFANDAFDRLVIQRRMAYLNNEHALIAARHIFGLKGGEL